MSKYSNDFKLEVVKYYNEQHCGYQCTANKFLVHNILFSLHFYHKMIKCDKSVNIFYAIIKEMVYAKR